MMTAKNTEEKIAVDHDASSEDSGSTLLPMLIAGIVLIVVGMVVVLMIV